MFWVIVAVAVLIAVAMPWNLDVSERSMGIDGGLIVSKA